MSDLKGVDNVSATKKTPKQLGDEYEVHVKEWLKPFYEKTWLHSEIPDNIRQSLKLPMTKRDLGFDILSLNFDGVYVFTQCKNYAKSTITQSKLSGFIAFLNGHRAKGLSGVFQICYNGKLSKRLMEFPNGITYRNIPFGNVPNVNVDNKIGSAQPLSGVIINKVDKKEKDVKDMKSADSNIKVPSPVLKTPADNSDVKSIPAIALTEPSELEKAKAECAQYKKQLDQLLKENKELRDKLSAPKTNVSTTPVGGDHRFLATARNLDHCEILLHAKISGAPIVNDHVIIIKCQKCGEINST